MLAVLLSVPLTLKEFGPTLTEFQAWCLEWYERLHAWSFKFFPMPGTGEWRQRLDRQGNPVTEVIALPVKDPFHLPRAVILILQLLGQRPS